MDIIEKLNWRYATKKFLERKIRLRELDTILEAANLTATSYGLQAFKIVVVDDPEIRQKLLPYSMDQSQIVDASHLLVLCRYKDVTDEIIQEFAQRIGESKSKTPDQIKLYAQKVARKVAHYKEAGKFEEWLTKQVYIVLGNLMTTCAVMGIDACPMEGFEPEKFDEILGLDALNLTSCVLLPVGYRSPSDTYQFKQKVRKDLEDLLLFI